MGPLMSDEQLIALATALLDLCRRKGLRIATAESCTGGLVAATLTEIAGSSDVVERGFVTYSNDAKEAMLHVPTATLARYGAVSRETAEAMADGAVARAPVDLAVSITGIAGPMEGPAVLQVAERPLEILHEQLQVRPVERDSAGEGLVHELVRDRHVGDQNLDPFRLGDAPAHLERAAERHELGIVLDVGDQVEHVGSGVPHPTRGGELRHASAGARAARGLEPREVVAGVMRGA